MNSLTPALSHGSQMTRAEYLQPSCPPGPTFLKRYCLLHSTPEARTLTRRYSLLKVRSVASEIPKRSNPPPTRLNHTSQDEVIEINAKNMVLLRKKRNLQERESRSLVEELRLPAVANDDESGACNEIVEFLTDKKTWLRDVAVLAVLAAAILSAMAEKEELEQNKVKKIELPQLIMDEVANGRAGLGRDGPGHDHVPIDSLRRGRLVENGFVYRQTFVVRSYEVGFDRTASIGTLANLFQETALNHVGMSDFVGDGMGTTHAMMRHRLIWVVTKMHIDVVEYPIWGDVVEIDSWVSGSGKNGMRRDFLVRDYLTGQVRARATSHWAMMHQDTRRLSKMPDDVRAEISPYYLERSVMTDESCARIQKLDDSAAYTRNGLVPRLHDMDMNQHVNHVKYISWVLESVPQSLLVAYELMSMTLEYRKECSHSDVVCSLTSPDFPHLPTIDNHELGLIPISRNHEVPRPPSIKNPHITTAGPIHYTHLLRLQSDSTEILRGWTAWRLKKRYL